MEINPYTPPSTAHDDGSSIKPGVIFKAWIVFFLLSVIGGFLVGAVVGAVIGAAMGASGASLESIRQLMMPIGFLISIPISYLCFRYSVVTFILRR